ncbi:hypothetical protein X777_00969 [Ooceraea biroi]|uniref:Uncharacterized protein n=1 Tax=Ooceraea biroi TaxID=2015173 RepID=A0A026WP82_OOCBI|nr:hypothetical protein X777_00969 [Ooceraea biroi]
MSGRHLEMSFRRLHCILGMGSVEGKSLQYYGDIDNNRNALRDVPLDIRYCDIDQQHCSLRLYRRYTTVHYHADQFAANA